MSAIQGFCHLFGINGRTLSREENFILEAELLVRVCGELKEIFRVQYKNYFKLMSFTIEMENTMLEENFIRLIIKDILSTQEYTLQGIAHYTATHEDVVHEVMIGKNTNPSASLLRRMIELHRLVRRDLYQNIAKKITEDCLAVA